MKTRALFTCNTLVLFLLVFATGARAQEQDTPKLEIGIQYSSLSINLPGFGGTENAPGVGARVTYNLNKYFAVEAEGNVFPSVSRRDYTTGGDSQQMQLGVKVGKRWKSFGLFAKARPGFVSFSETLTPVQVQSGSANVFRYDRERKTHLSTDVGGVLEFYPSHRMLVRFDAGDTIIRYGGHTVLLPAFNGTPILALTPVGSEVKHNFQFTAGVGFRFGGGADDDAGAAQTSPTGERVRRFEVAMLFSSFVLNLSPSAFGAPSFAPFNTGSNAEAGIGLRVGYNVTNDLAVEAEGTLYPRRRFDANTTIGGYPVQFQTGVKYGRRFQRFGLFAKARPGFFHFSNVSHITSVETFNFEGQQFFLPNFAHGGRSYFSMDLGGVLEFYPSERIFTRFDVGDTMIRYSERDSPGFFTPTPPTRLPAELRHNLQVTASIGFRF